MATDCDVMRSTVAANKRSDQALGIRKEWEYFITVKMYLLVIVISIS